MGDDLPHVSVSESEVCAKYNNIIQLDGNISIQSCDSCPSVNNLTSANVSDPTGCSNESAEYSTGCSKENA